MGPERFKKMTSAELIEAAYDAKLGISRAFAIEELALRSLIEPDLLPAACAAIASDRRIGFHAGVPIGWLGADAIFLASNNRSALSALLREMEAWSASEQEDLVRHWAGKGKLIELTRQLQESFNWRPSYLLETA